MRKIIKRGFCLFLVAVLLAGLVPYAFADEASPTETAEASEAATEPTEVTTAPAESTEPPSETTEATEPEADLVEDNTADDRLLPDNISTYASTVSNVLLFDQASPNYTTVLSSQISVTYQPNGTDAAKTAYIKNLGWHFARYNNTPYEDDPIYCIEPCKNYGASTSGNYMDQGLGVSGSGSSRGSNVWYAMPSSYRQAIALTLLYSKQLWNSNYSVKTTAMANNPNVSTRIATQFLIYEIVTGLRDASTFNRKSSNGYSSGDVFYNAGVANVSGFADKYNSIVSSVQSAMKIPSFTSRSSDSAPTITMNGSQVSVTDSNGVLGNFSFTNGSGASFSKSGNTLTITKTGTISPSTVFSATRSLPSAGNSTVSIYYSASSTYQTCVKLYSPQVETLRAYFKINAPDPGAIALVKTTEDGQNLSGWRFGVYSNAACTTLVSGPHTTDSNGKISITGLNAGTYYVKELGHTNSAISSRYTCSGENPQKVTVSNGTTTSVSFYNKLSSGSVKITKTTNTGQNLGGWKIGLYTDSACTNPISGSPFTTGSDGTVTVSGLQPGTLYAKELASSDPYWVCDTSVKTVTVAAGQTASVSFTNTQYGALEIRKSTNTGNHLDGWKFIVKKDGAEIPGSPFTTDETGIIRISNLSPGKYLVLESPTEDPYWSVELGYHTVTVEYGKTAVDQWLNKEQGLGYFTKSTNTGDEISGWHITVYADEACTQELHTLITGQDGTVGIYLEPGTYWVKETGSEEVRDDYWKMDDTVKKLVIRAHEKTTLEFVNNYSGRISIQKSVEPEGTLEGWKFKITDADGKEVSGSPFTTDEDGKILTGNLTPGDYTVEEVLPTDSLYTGEAPKTVTVTAGKTAEVSFLNKLRTGKITIRKVDTKGEPLAGATFLLEGSEDGNLWYPVIPGSSGICVLGERSEENLAAASKTSGEDGLLTWENLPTTLQYRITETKAPEGYTLLKDYAFVGTLPADNIEMELRVVNGEAFTVTGNDNSDSQDGGAAWNYDVVVYPKQETGIPTLEKTVREAKADTGKNEGSASITDGYAHTATGSAGDTMEYQIVSTLPTITSQATALSTYNFYDALCEGLTYSKDVGVTVEFFTDAACTDKVATWNQDSGKFTVTYSEDGRHMTVDIAKAGLAEINGATANKNGKLYTGYSNYTARVTYSAVINSDKSFAYGEKGNENTVVLTWKRTSGDYYDTLIDDCHVFSFGLDLTKLFSDVDVETAAETKLYDSVKFKIQNKTDGTWIIAKRNDEEGIYYVTGHTNQEADATVFTPVTMGKSYGHIMVKGLEEDTYTITETQTANGYTLLKNAITVTITVKENTSNTCNVYAKDVLGVIQNDPHYAFDGGEDLKLANIPQRALSHNYPTASATVDKNEVTMLEDNGSANAEVPLTVKNTKGFDLPKTGDHGTWMYSLVGILMMSAAAGVIVLTTRKKNGR